MGHIVVKGGDTMKTRILAIEEHFSTPLYREKNPVGDFFSFYISSRSEQIGHRIPEELGDVDAERIAQMDKAGVDIQVLSFNTPGPQAFAANEAITMAQDANDRLYAIVQKYPSRFAGFAALPTADPTVAVQELERTVKNFGFKGAMIHGHQQGEFLDAKKYWPIWERAEALDVPIYLHPALAPHPAALHGYFAGYEELARSGWGFAIDTSIHFLRIMFSGVFDAYPKLTFILGHLGEGLPFAMHRLNDHTWRACKRRGLKNTPLEYIQNNLLVTTSGNWYEPAFFCTLLALGADKIMFAIDWPYEANTTGVDFLKRLSISDDDRAKIAYKNAERVLRM